MGSPKPPIPSTAMIGKYDCGPTPYLLVDDLCMGTEITKSSFATRHKNGAVCRAHDENLRASVASPGLAEAACRTVVRNEQVFFWIDSVPSPEVHFLQ